MFTVAMATQDPSNSMNGGFSIQLSEQQQPHEHRLSSIRTEQYNFNNVLYTGTLWMGSGAFKQDVAIVFDTGSDWLIVEVE